MFDGPAGLAGPDSSAAARPHRRTARYAAKHRFVPRPGGAVVNGLLGGGAPVTEELGALAPGPGDSCGRGAATERRRAPRAGLIAYLVTVFLLVTLNFFLPRAMPGDAVSALVDDAAPGRIQDDELRADLAEYYGLDRPVLGQYVAYLGDLVRGDLGTSIRYNVPVADLVRERLPWTALLVVSGIALAAPFTDTVVNALKAIGVELQPPALDTPAFNQRVNRGEADMYLITAGGMNSELAPDYLRLAYSSDARLTQRAYGYQNPEVDELAKKQLNTVDDRERKDAVARLQEAIARDVPLLPLCHPDSFSITRKATFDQWYITPGGGGGGQHPDDQQQARVRHRHEAGPRHPAHPGLTASATPVANDSPADIFAVQMLGASGGDTDGLRNDVTEPLDPGSDMGRMQWVRVSRSDAATVVPS